MKYFCACVLLLAASCGASLDSLPVLYGKITLPQKIDSDTLHELKIGEQVIKIPLPHNAIKSNGFPVQTAEMEMHQYQIFDVASETLIHYNIGNPINYNKDSLAQEDFEHIKSSLKVIFKFEMESIIETTKKQMNIATATLVSEIRILEENNEYIAAFLLFTEQGPDLITYTPQVNGMLLVNGICIALGYGHTVKNVSEHEISRIKETALAWRDAILAANE